MYPPLRLRSLGILVASLLGLAGCSMAVSSYVSPGVRFTQYKTYNWGPADPFTTGDPRLDNNPFFNDRLRADVERHLTAKGFEKSAESPDLLIHVHASVSQRLDVYELDRLSGYCRDANCQPHVSDAGTLTLDFVDTRTNTVVWRGWAEGAVNGVVENQKWMEEKIDEAVTRILERLPARL